MGSEAQSPDAPVARPGLQRPFARARPRRMPAPARPLPRSPARPRPPRSLLKCRLLLGRPYRPGAAPPARPISAVCFTAYPAGPVPQQPLTAPQLPPCPAGHQGKQPPPLCELLSSSAAAGKSTFVRLLEKHSDEWEIIPEPIAKWCNIQTAEDEFEVGAQDLAERNCQGAMPKCSYT